MNENREILKSVSPLMCAVGVLVLLWLFILYGFGSQMKWAEINPSPQLPATALPSVRESEPPPSLNQYAKVWSDPLFTPGRVPDSLNFAPEPVRPVPPLAGYVLTGVIITQQLSVALLKANTGEVFSLKKGQLLPNGWRLDQVSERQVELIYEQNRQTLEIVTPKLPNWLN
ncbi:hypothetical protein OH708_00925 [Pseudomonas capsici]|uniref:hypothetical protein n=1 Tax=Pseudomonas capsici TaxID=2810614 RepID=UPI0021F234D4|nr:hypothetical protein [Pseudomonas capsici]MCV4286458.1 hypothetical protein [Pseudomonas capsici]